MARHKSRVIPLVAALILLSAGRAFAQVSPEETLKSFEVADGLEASVWATEPMLVNPTNIDIDARGRVWVLEGANYRTSITRPEGDRIVILEDTDHDGKADRQKVFAQDPALQSPLGIAVLGTKVYVSQSPNIWVYTIDETGDMPVGKPEIWITGFEGVNHDHGVHAIVFGPDGKLYFNCGNDGCKGKEPFKRGDGTSVVDSTGSDVPRGKMWRGADRKPGELGYQEGMAFRCNPDGSGFETLGHNFRNNFELAVDSFGTVWQSDNDDDGNESVRINYVMEGGDFGYHGPKGHDWNRDNDAFPGQTKQQAHWHQKWPGVVPNLLHTGGGSPTGIVVYEGELLPKRFQGALIHCDPGPNVVRAYIPKRSAQVPVKKFNEPDSLKGPDREGAGYAAEVVNILRGKDSWFRPSDVCVAPDGSLFIADWYDPGVGGHQTADLPKDAKPDWQKLRGRIYRVAPNGNKPVVPKLDLSTVVGQIAALKSPNLGTRYLALQKLRTTDKAVRTQLNDLSEDESERPEYRARAIWLLGDDSRPLKEKNPDLRIASLRAIPRNGMPASFWNTLADDPSPAVRREVALALNYLAPTEAVSAFVKLANQFDGEDRWYLEALGIGATGKEEAVLAAWEKDGKNTTGKAGDLIRWRLKKESPAQVRLNERTSVIGEWWAAAPFDAAADDPLGSDFGPDASPAAIHVSTPLKGLGDKPVKWQRLGTTPYESAVVGLRYFDFEAWCDEHATRSTKVVGYFATNLVSPAAQSGKLLIGSDDFVRVWLNGQQVHEKKLRRAVRFAEDVVPVEFRAGHNVLFVKLFQHSGTSGLLVAAEGEKQKVTASEAVPGAASDAVAQSGTTGVTSIQSDVPHTKDGQPVPSIDELAKTPGDANAGEAVFASETGAKCISCHQIGNRGRMLGPPLTTIGQKLSKAQLYEAILKPNAGILMGYESWVVKTKKGDVISGLKTSESPDAVTIKDTDGKYHDIPAKDIARLVKQKISIMPENLSQAMTRKELVDLVEYLSTLRNQG